MYTLKTEHSFDAAHFLYGYEGKCSNIHGHRWRVVAEVSSDELETTGQNRGMYVDFGDLKKDLNRRLLRPLPYYRNWQFKGNNTEGFTG